MGKKKINIEVVEEVLNEMDVVAKPAIVKPSIAKKVPATGRFQMVKSEAGIGIYNQIGNLVGKETDEQKARDMIMRFNYLSGIK